MKKQIALLFILALTLAACKTPQRVTSTWVNKEALPRGPYKSIMVIVMAKDISAKFTIEKRLAALISSRGQKVVESGDVFPPSLAGNSKESREILKAAIARTGCDAVFTMAVLDVKTEKNYQQSSFLSPVSMYDFYGNYGSYYAYRLDQVYAPGYYTENKTYFLETNFYDLKDDLLLWSIQSTACNPKDLEKFFKDYSSVIFTELKTQGLLAK
jgi:hypothetical protein